MRESPELGAARSAGGIAQSWGRREAPGARLAQDSQFSGYQNPQLNAYGLRVPKFGGVAVIA